MAHRQVAGPDAAFLYGERPEWHFHVSALTILDPSASGRFGLEEVVAQLSNRVHQAPQFRWKLLEGPLRMRLERPMWVDDPDFSVRRHVHHVAVPSPGDDRSLGNLVGRLVSFKIDRTRPLWEVWFIEGLADGRVALLTKMHHSIIDGASGVDLFTLLYDLVPDPEPDPEPPLYEPEPPPRMVERLTVGTTNAAVWPLKTARFSRQLLRQGVTMGRHARRGSPPARPLQAPRTSLNGRLTSERVFASAALPLADAKLVKDAFGVKLNDVILAVSSTALRTYLIGRDELPDRPLIAQVPVSLRSEANRDHIGTKVAALFCSLATDIDDPIERLRAIRSSTISGKQMREELSTQQEINLTDTMAPAAIAVAARAWSLAGLDGRTPPLFNVIISNMPGPPFDLYLAGARVVALYPMGPLLYGSGLNLSIVSSAESLHFGLIACPDLVPDPEVIAALLGPALAELVAATGAA